MKVTLQNLTKRFPNRNRKGPDVIAVNDFSFEIPDGKLIGLLGPSGCGKSTTLNLISGLEKPTQGKIFFGEDDVTELPPENRGVGEPVARESLELFIFFQAADSAEKSARENRRNRENIPELRDAERLERRRIQRERQRQSSGSSSNLTPSCSAGS